MEVCSRKEFVEINRRAYMETGSEEDGLKLFFAQWNLGDYWDDLSGKQRQDSPDEFRFLSEHGRE